MQLTKATMQDFDRIRDFRNLGIERRKKAFCFDTPEVNFSAQRLYSALGFVPPDKQCLYAENAGWTDFLFYERIFG